MWRSIFLHEFLDTNIYNFHAIPGTANPGSLTPTPSPPLRTHAVHISSGQGFRYQFDKTFEQVIGISGRVRILLPFWGVLDDPVSIIRLGNMVEFKILQKSVILGNGLFMFRQTGLLRIGQTEFELGTVDLVPLITAMFGEVKFDWHTSGQARLFYNGGLVGYHNAVAPGVQFDVSDLAFGMPDAPQAAKPNYTISKVFVRALRESDFISDFSKFYPAIPFPDPGAFETCQLVSINNLISMAYRLRQFMADFNRNLSQPWTSASGPADGPFQPEAIAARELARRAGSEVARMMRTRDFSSADAFLESFEEFLLILQDTQGGEFTRFVQEMIEHPLIPAECAALIESIREEHKEALGPLLDVLSKANQRVKDIAGVV